MTREEAYTGGQKLQTYIRIRSFSQVVREFADVTLDSVKMMVGKEQFVPPFPRMLELIQAQLSVGGCREGQFPMGLQR